MPQCQTPIIVALDYSDAKSALACVDQLDPKDCRVKVGKTLFVKEGPVLIHALHERGFEVFLDLKFYDIPAQVAGAVKSACDLGVWMLTLHASGGPQMMRAAAEAAKSHRAEQGSAPLIIAVTLLTSFSDEEMSAIGYQWSNTADGVMSLAELAHASGVDGVVSSAQEAKQLKSRHGNDFLSVTPGIRPASSDHDDQRRVMTPAMALAQGSDYLVIGRPITKADDPDYALKKIILDINA